MNYNSVPLWWWLLITWEALHVQGLYKKSPYTPVKFAVDLKLL